MPKFPVMDPEGSSRVVSARSENGKIFCHFYSLVLS
jgi:hypothetical protein